MNTIDIKGVCVNCGDKLSTHFDYVFREGNIGFMSVCLSCNKITIEWFSMEYVYSSEERSRDIPEII